MAGITLAQAEAKLAAYLAAEETVLTGQAYTLFGRSVTRANLTSLRNGIEIWDKRVKDLSARAGGRGRSRTINPNW